MENNNDNKNSSKNTDTNVHNVVNVEEKEIDPEEAVSQAYYDELKSLIEYFEKTSPHNKKNPKDSPKTKQKLITAGVLSSIGVVGYVVSRFIPELINNHAVSEVVRTIGQVVSYIGISGSLISLISSSVD